MNASLPPPYPTGWYALAFSRELPRGGVVTRRLGTSEVVLFRTESGVVGATEPYCPHMGAHLGHGGRVQGETLRCPFHGFCFDRQGACVSTPYDGKPPKARLGTHHVREQSGLVLVFLDALGQAPTWEVAPLDMTGYSPLIWRSFTLRGHPQETTENSVDIGHLSVVHGYRAVSQLAPLETRGPYLTTRYAFDKFAVGKLFPMRVDITIHAWGLGYSLVETDVAGLHLRQFVLSTPIGEQEIALRLAIGVNQTTAVRGVAARAVAELIMAGFSFDVRQDFAIWSHKRYVNPPVLAEGDGPIGTYRRWARQFYPELVGEASQATHTERRVPAPDPVTGTASRRSP